MGDYVTIGQSLIITGFSIVVVFVGLIIISLLIDALKIISGDKKTEVEKTVVPPVKVDPVEKEEIRNEVNDEELVAVISAAIAASMGLSVPQLNIKSIRRVEQNTPVWAVASRQEQITRKL